MTPPVVLASGSPRRTRLLDAAHLAHTVVVTGVPEPAGLSPLALAAAKLAAARRLPTTAGAVVLAADTVVRGADGRIHAKPDDDADAADMLAALCGTTIRVETGIALARPDGTSVAAVGVTRLRLVSVDDAARRAYLATGEHRDKAGALSLQGAAAGWIAAIDGCATNLIGLPLCTVQRELAAAGVELGAPVDVAARCATTCPDAAADVA